MKTEIKKLIICLGIIAYACAVIFPASLLIETKIGLLIACFTLLEAGYTFGEFELSSKVIAIAGAMSFYMLSTGIEWRVKLILLLIPVAYNVLVKEFIKEPVKNAA